MSLLKLKLIYLEKTTKDGANKWFEALTILNNKGAQKWVKVVFGDEVNEKLFKNENQILFVKAENIEPHTFGFKSWQDKNGKWHNPYIKILAVEKFEKAISQTRKAEIPIINQDLFVIEEDDTEATTIESQDLPFNDED